MRSGCSVVAAIFSIILLTVIFSPFSAGTPVDDLRISEVDPFGEYEGVSLFNYGTDVIDLRGWSISDGEGSISFTKTLHIMPDSRVTIVREMGENWFSNRENTFSIGTYGIEKTGSYILSNTGDDIYLISNGKVVDVVCYGNKIAAEGWIGDPVGISSGKYLLRQSIIDTDSSADWITTKPGLTDRPFDHSLFYDAVVTPFSFPESSGMPIFDAIRNAKEEVLISMYLLTSVSLVSLLCDMVENKGIKVTILLEGDVLGVDISTELTLMKSLANVGGEVYLINDPVPENFERYSYFHNKYAVIDQETTIVTSENWTESNLGDNCSNRGWGVVIECNDFAEYLRAVFLNDIDTSYGDVRELTEQYPNLKSYSGQMGYDHSEIVSEPPNYEARIMPILSPDNSLTALEYLMGTANERIYSQQLDLGTSFRLIDDRSPIGWMSEHAERGIDCRFILDSSVYGKGTSSEDIVGLINSTTNVKAITSEKGNGFVMTHNKGIIIDDMVWVGSVNWTENSFINNREVAVVIDSVEVCEYFSDLFLRDWGENEHTVAEEGLTVTMTALRSHQSEVFLFEVSGPENASYTWDVLGNGELRSTDINRMICTDLPEGTHTLNVTLNGTPYSTTFEYDVERNGDPSDEAPWNIIIASGLLGVGCLGALFKGRYNNSRVPIRNDDHKADDRF